MNALRHGLLSQCVLLPGENHEIFDALHDQYMAKFEPADGVELSAVEAMVAAEWRQCRLMAIESRLLANAANKRPEPDALDRIAGAFGDLAHRPELNLIHRYEGRLIRMQQRALQNLFLLSDTDPDNYPPDAQSAPQPTEPASNNQTNPTTDNPSNIIPLQPNKPSRPAAAQPCRPVSRRHFDLVLPAPPVNRQFRAPDWTVPREKQRR